jgi:hypothetical protein
MLHKMTDEIRESIINNPNLSDDDKQALLAQVNQAESTGRVFTDKDTSTSE